MCHSLVLPLHYLFRVICFIYFPQLHNACPLHAQAVPLFV